MEQTKWWWSKRRRKAQLVALALETGQPVHVCHECRKHVYINGKDYCAHLVKESDALVAHKGLQQRGPLLGAPSKLARKDKEMDGH